MALQQIHNNISLNNKQYLEKVVIKKERKKERKKVSYEIPQIRKYYGKCF